MTFVGVCFAFVNICQKKEKRENNEKMGFGFYSKVIHVMSMKKVENSFAIFLVSCDFCVGPVSQTAIFHIFTLWYSKDYLKHTL